MKALYIAALIALASVAVVNAAEDGKHLFILSGQSNMARLDPNTSFTPAVEAAFGKDNVIVVKDAQGGKPIRRWYKQWPIKGNNPKSIGDLYDRMLDMVNKAIEGKKLASVTFVWMQGESDGGQLHGDKYAVSLKGLVDQLITDLGRKDINVVIGRLSDYQPKTEEKQAHWQIIRKVQVEFAETYPRGAWVDVDDLNNIKKGDVYKNGLHYTEEGYKTLGKRFAEKAIELINKK